MGLRETVDIKVVAKTKLDKKEYTKDENFEMNWGWGIFQKSFSDNELDLPFERISKSKHKRISALTIDCAKPGNIMSNQENVNDEHRKLNKEFKEQKGFIELETDNVNTTKNK
jgi:hypothetical protein